MGDSGFMKHSSSLASGVINSHQHSQHHQQPISSALPSTELPVWASLPGKQGWAGPGVHARCLAWSKLLLIDFAMSWKGCRLDT